MSISGIGSYPVIPSSQLTAGASGTKGAAASSVLPTTADASSSSGSDALDYLTKYLKESPAKRMEDAWLAQHHLTEQQLSSMPPEQQDAIRKQMAEDIKRKMQEQSGAPGSNANITV